MGKSNKNKRNRKNKYRKGFTFVEILAVIVLIGILSSIAIVGVSRYRENAKNKDYEALAKSAYNGMEEYLIAHPYKTEASLETLEKGSFISNRKDPATKSTDCTGSVEVKTASGSNGILDSGEYIVYLCCTNYKKKYIYPTGVVEDYTGTNKCDIEEVPEDPGVIPTPLPGETTYSITYNLNGGTVSGNPNKYSESMLPLTIKNPSRSGYTFNGWTGSNGNTAQTTVTIKKGTTGAKTYTANWTKNTTPSYVVTLNNNGATKAGTASVNVKVGDNKLPTITLPKKTVTITYVNNVGATVSGGDKSKNYTLNGWYTATSGGNKVASNATTPVLQKSVSGYTDSSGKWAKKSNTTLYAQWSSVTATLPTITKSGYTCKWTTVDGGQTKERTSGGTWTFTSANSRTFTAVCTSNGTKPSCTIAVSAGTKGNNDWYKSDVTIKMTTQNNPTTQGLATSKKSTNGQITAKITSDGTVTYYGYVKNSAGEGTCEISIKKDSTIPTCGTASGASTTWTKSNRTIRQACADTTSKCVKTSYDTSYSSTTKTASVTISDKAGNTKSCTYNVYVDKTAPSCGAVSGGSSTWTKNNRTLKQACSDNHSGCTQSVFEKTFSSSTKIGTITIKDKAGNTTDCSKNVNVYIDKTAPTCGTATNSSTTWTNSNRTIKQACNDAHSGCVKASYDTKYTTTKKTDSVTIKDKNGNTKTCTYNVYVDKTAPTCGNVTGDSTTWTKNDRTIKVECKDTNSGCVKAKYEKKYTSTRKKGKIAISDSAGNSTDCEVNVYVDQTAPIMHTTNGSSKTFKFRPSKRKDPNGSKNVSSSVTLDNDECKRFASNNDDYDDNICTKWYWEYNNVPYNNGEFWWGWDHIDCKDSGSGCKTEYWKWKHDSNQSSTWTSWSTNYNKKFYAGNDRPSYKHGWAYAVDKVGNKSDEFEWYLKVTYKR